MPAKQDIYKDLVGDRKAKLQNFILNPKATDPIGADRIPQELYTNTTDDQLKYYDDNLDLRYSVPGIVKSTPPTVLDLDYDIGQEWRLDGGSATYKLLDKDTRNGTLEAIWVEQELLIPLIKATSQLSFYVDYDTGDDNNNGKSTNPYKTIAGAIADINARYDFVGIYRYTIIVVSATQPFGLTKIPEPVGAAGQQFIIQGQNPDTELVLTGTHGFYCYSDVELKISNFKLVSPTSRTSFINGFRGRITLTNCTLSGEILYPFFLLGSFRLISTNNFIEDLTAQNLVRASHSSDYFQNGDFTAKGVNSFTSAVFYLNQNATATLNTAADILLDTGATVTGRRFLKYQNSNLSFLKGIDQMLLWGDGLGYWTGGGTYNTKSRDYNYSHLVEGLAISLSGSDLAIAPGEVRIKAGLTSVSSEYYAINTYPATVIPFADTGLATKTELWIYAINGETFQFLAVPPDADNLLQRVCLGKITTVDGITIDTVQPLISERSPELLDSWNAPGTIDNCVIANAAMTNLNDSLLGTKWVFDALTFSTSSPIYTATADGIKVAAAGTYRIDAILNTSVATNGAQRASVGIRIAINGVERTVAGRSAYMRRAGSHYRSSTTVFARVVLNPGDEITMIGFRDATGGTVSCPAGESELTIMKLT